MSEVLHGGHEQHAFPNSELSLFPDITFHFSLREMGIPAPVHAAEAVRAASTSASYITNALTHPSRVIVMGGPFLPETVVLKKSEEGVLMLRRRRQEDGSIEVTARHFGQKPEVQVWFDGDMNLGFRMRDSNQPEQQDLTITSSLEDGLIIFVGTLEHDVRRRYVHAGGKKREGVISERMQEAFAAIKKEIERTEKNEKEGVLRASYLERISESGGRLYYRERTETETRIEEYLALKDRSVILIPGSTSWHFSRYHEHLHLPFTL